MITALGDIALVLRNGLSVKQAKEEDGLPVSRIETIAEGEIDPERVGYAGVSAGEKDEWLLNKGDILISHINSTAHLGKSAIYRGVPEKIIHGMNLLCLRVRKDVADPVFVQYMLSSPAFKRQIPRITKHSVNQSSFNISSFKELSIPLPPLPEQRRISEILDKSDAIRRKRCETIRLVDDFLRSVFLDMFGAYLDKDSEAVFGEFLEEPLNNGFFAKNDIYGEGAPVVWVDNLYHTMSIKTAGLRRARMSEADLGKYAVCDGDLLFTRSSLVAEGVGQINIVPALDEPTAFECHIIRARVNRQKLNPFYVLGLYRSTFGKQHVLRNANTATMTTISQSALERLPCPVPPLRLQNEFEAIVRQTGRARNSLERASHIDEELMGCLMQKAFKGEV